MTASSTGSPVVDVIIPVHTPQRPIGRAVSSVLLGSDDRVRVTVVAHNTDRSAIVKNLAAHSSDPRLRVIAHTDGIHSPAGPMNAGLAAASGDFLSVMGSDDQLEPGAIASWLACQGRADADVVIPRIHIVGRGSDPYPPVRPFRRHSNLDAVKDRLAYRSAPLGLVRRARFGEMRFTERLGSGEDLAYSITLWFTANVISYDADGPAYVGIDDAPDRVTFTPRPLREDFGFIDAIEALPWWQSAEQTVKDAIVVKILRIHLMDAIRARVVEESAQVRERIDLVGVLDRLNRISPRASRLVSLADARVFRALTDPAADSRRIRDLLTRRQQFFTPRALVPAAPYLLLHRQSALRTLTAAAINLRRMQR